MTVTLYAVVFTAGSISASRAGAWPQPQAQTTLISRITTTTAPNAFGPGGQVVGDADFEKTEIEAHVEYGWRETVTLLAKPTLQHTIVGSQRRTGLATIETGARARLHVFEEDQSVLSGQVSLILPMREHDQNNPLITSGHTDIDVRLLNGVPGTLLGWPDFGDSQLAYRHRGGGAPDEIRLDMTYGVHVNPDWTLTTQSFTVLTVGEARPPFQHFISQKVQLSVRWQFESGKHIEFGGVRTLSGMRTVRESGAFLSLWTSF
ncbi:MAG: hypothetical protein ACFB0Z_13810 [Candidatus Phaeomarinobacter sp.]|mgnify:CR=1 FL=1